jgi:hypothetical protein
MSFGRSSSTVKLSVRYEAADTNTAHSTLTIRDEESAPRVPLSSSAWAFGNCPIGQASLVPDDMHICLFLARTRLTDGGKWIRTLGPFQITSAPSR